MSSLADYIRVVLDELYDGAALVCSGIAWQSARPAPFRSAEYLLVSDPERQEARCGVPRKK